MNERKFTVADGRIVEIDAIADPERVRRITAHELALNPTNMEV